MAQNTMADLRNHLFATLEELMDKDVKDIDKDRIKQIVAVSNSIINSAKVEVEFHRMAGTTDPESRFFNQKQLS
jgi:hypothetical protein